MTITTIESPVDVVLVEILDTSNVIGVLSPDASFVEIVEAVAPPLVLVVQPSQYLEVIDTAIRGAPGDTGPTGPTGPAGPAGKTIISTTGAPAVGVGVNGDYAYDTVANVFYGPKAAGAWPAGIYLGSPAAMGAGMSVAFGTTQTGASGVRVVRFDSLYTANNAAFTLNLAAGTITVPTTGWYLVVGRVRNAAAVSGEWDTNLQVNGVVRTVSDIRFGGTGAGSAASPIFGVSLTTSIYLTAGDVVSLGMYSDNTVALTSLVTGDQTYFRVVLLTGGAKGDPGPTGPAGVVLVAHGTSDAAILAMGLPDGTVVYEKG